MGTKLDPADAAKAMERMGYLPLEPFKGTKIPIRTRHLKCGEVVDAKYYTVINGKDSCKKCRDKKIALDPQEAFAFMVSKNLKPLVPYVSAHDKWKCVCLICGGECEPAYSWIKGGQGGCKNCANKSRALKTSAAHASEGISRTRTKRTEEDALGILASVGRTALEPFVRANKSWKSSCNACGTVGSPTLHMLNQRGNQCKTCGTARTAKSKYLDESHVIEVLRKAGVELLQEYHHDNSEPLKSRCLKCKRIVHPSYASAKRTRQGCKYCAGIYVDPDEAKTLMISFGYEPLEDYQGTDKPWKCRHVICGTVGKPTYGTIKRGGGGCRNCAEWGFSYNRPSYIYLITHEEFGAHKVGIANVAKAKKSDRLHKFGNHGWSLVRKWDFPDGQLVPVIEASVFQEIRVERGIPQFLKKGTMKYEGETETMDASLIDLKALEKLIKIKIKQAIKMHQSD